MLTSPAQALRRHTRRTSLGVLALLLGLAGLLAAPGAAEAATQSVSVAPGGKASVTDGGAFVDGFGLANFAVPATSARPVTVGVQFRGTSASDGYRTSVLIANDGSLRLRIIRVKAGAETTLVEKAIATKVAAGKKINVQGWAHGTSSVLLRARAWVDGQAKPDWLASYTDSSSTVVKTSAAARVVVSLASSATSNATVSLATTMNAEAKTTSTTNTPPAPAPAPAPAANISSPGKRLNASQVGVPAGTSLTQHNGDLTITKAGTVIDRMDIHGIVFVRAANVKITRSIIRGGPSKYHVGMITNQGEPGLVVEDSDLIAAKPLVNMNGVQGSAFTLRRVHIQGGVDNVQITGSNVRIESSLLEKMNYFTHDPSQNNGPTHNDAVQILGGSNIVITGTTALAAGLNFAILGGAEYSDVQGLKITNNYVDGGHCNVKLAVRNGHSESATVTGNTFGPNIAEKTCPLVAEKAVSLTQSGNVSEVTGKAIVALRI
jgi:hypothetical protein